VICFALVIIDVGTVVGVSPNRLLMDTVSQRLVLNYIIQPLFIMAFSFAKVASAIILVRTKQARRWQSWGLHSLASSQMLSAIIAIHYRSGSHPMFTNLSNLESRDIWEVLAGYGATGL